jgi:hypothetical protein
MPETLSVYRRDDAELGIGRIGSREKAVVVYEHGVRQFTL